MDVTEPLTKLLTQPLLRAEFRADPRATACRLVREDTLRATLVGLCPDQLDVQARLLIAKRWREVVALAPRSCEGRFSLFQTYAGTFWPTGHQRHHIDALGFLASVAADGQRVCDAERLALGRARWVLRLGTVATDRGWRPGLALAAGGSRWTLCLG